MNTAFFKNKSVRIALGISLIILVLVIIFSPKRKTIAPETGGTTSQLRAELTDLSKEKRQQAMVYTASIEAKLPLYLENFQTSVNIPTSINIYRLDTDEAEVVRIEIYGLSYLNQDANEKKNPNVTAFKESYRRAMEMLESRNIDPNRLIFIYGDKEYVRKTAEHWVSELKLRP